MSQDYNVKLDRISSVCTSLHEAIDELLVLCDDPDDEVRYRTLELFFDVKNEKIEETVCRLLRDGSELVRVTCLEVLGAWGDASKEQYVLQMLTDESELVRSAAIVAIGDLRIFTAVETLEKMLPTCGEEEEVRIYYALYKLRKYEYLSLFLDGLFHEFYRIRCATANLAVDLIDKNNKDFILNLLLQKIQTEETVAAKSSIEGAIATIREIEL